LITTFNATLPFYEEVLLRKLVGAGCRHNVVLMDRSQCAVSWSSEATRPRLAGHAYTLLPIGAPGAFHPKLCILVGPKKASILIGSHNLTLSGFGFNREVTNWIEVSGPKDSEGAALLGDSWWMARQWIEMERGKAADSLLEAALAVANFVNPLVANAEPSSRAVALTHAPLGVPLIDQISERISPAVSRIGIVGPSSTWSSPSRRACKALAQGATGSRRRSRIRANACSAAHWASTICGYPEVVARAAGLSTRQDDLVRFRR
jgi:hypothetical protein